MPAGGVGVVLFMPGLELGWGWRKWFDWCQQRLRRACNWPGYKEDSWWWQNMDVASWACRWGWRNGGSTNRAGLGGGAEVALYLSGGDPEVAPFV